MTYMRHLLVVANVTATSGELLAALRERAETGPVAVTLLMPASEPGAVGRADCEQRLAEVLEHWREAGIEATGMAGDNDALEAVMEAWEPGRYDEVLVSTLPPGASRWLQADLPHRIARLTDAYVSHVVAAPPPRRFRARREPPREPHPLGPLSVLAWGGPRPAGERRARG